jgi:hypothetical protein
LRASYVLRARWPTLSAIDQTANYSIGILFSLGKRLAIPTPERKGPNRRFVLAYVLRLLVELDRFRCSPHRSKKRQPAFDREEHDHGKQNRHQLRDYRLDPHPDDVGGAADHA